MKLGGVGRGRIAILAITAALAAGGWATAGSADAAGLLGLNLGAPAAASNPDPLTDLGASLLPLVTGGTQRICATSGRGIAVHCVDNVSILPSADQAATADTLGHWIFCKTTCAGSLLTHELVHVGQFETYGDLFGPMYITEALIHGDGCANQWELPAYRATGAC